MKFFLIRKEAIVWYFPEKNRCQFVFDVEHHILGLETKHWKIRTRSELEQKYSLAFAKFALSCDDGHESGVNDYDVLNE